MHLEGNNFEGILDKFLPFAIERHVNKEYKYVPVITSDLSPRSIKKMRHMY